MDDEYKYLYLMNSLEGPALKAVSGLRFTPLAYKVAKQCLEKKYGATEGSSL